jgi:hypothetical protein
MHSIGVERTNHAYLSLFELAYNSNTISAGYATIYRGKEAGTLELSGNPTYPMYLKQNLRNLARPSLELSFLGLIW